MSGIGIVGLGVELPGPARANDWWPAEVVAAWSDRAIATMWRGVRTGDSKAQVRPATELEERVAAAMAELRTDPFRGARRRHVMPDELVSSDVEVVAARRAIASAGLNPEDIDLLLVQSVNPDHLGVSNACIVHRKLELRRDCASISTEGMCNAFQTHLGLAEAWLARGGGGHALLVQSCCISPLLDQADPSSGVFGDAATATVLGPVAAEGLMAAAHGTDSALYPSVVFGVPGRRWHDQGRVVTYLADTTRARQMVYCSGDIARQAILGALAKLDLPPSAVDFYAAHQPAPWFRRVTQEAAGLERARSFETFESYANAIGCNIPLVLHDALVAGELRPGDLVATFSAAPGVVWTGSILRWSLSAESLNPARSAT